MAIARLSSIHCAIFSLEDFWWLLDFAMRCSPVIIETTFSGHDCDNENLIDLRHVQDCKILHVPESEHHDVASTQVANTIMTPSYLAREFKMEDKMKLSLCYDHEKQDAVIYNIFIVITIQPHSGIFWKCPEQDVAASPIWQTTLKQHQLCLSSHYQLWYWILPKLY